jgi:hypothetical protein
MSERDFIYYLVSHGFDGNFWNKDRMDMNIVTKLTNARRARKIGGIWKMRVLCNGQHVK